eukprot:XP_020398476.1 wiskott-Aldrich syndrome protein homolog 1-like [Zea mays]
MRINSKTERKEKEKGKGKVAQPPSLAQLGRPSRPPFPLFPPPLGPPRRGPFQLPPVCSPTGSAPSASAAATQLPRQPSAALGSLPRARTRLHPLGPPRPSQIPARARARRPAQLVPAQLAARASPQLAQAAAQAARSAARSAPCCAHSRGGRPPPPPSSAPTSRAYRAWVVPRRSLFIFQKPEPSVSVAQFLGHQRFSSSRLYSLRPCTVGVSPSLAALAAQRISPSHRRRALVPLRSSAEGLSIYKPARPPVPEDAADRAVRRLAAEKEKEKKDVEKAQARERMRARDALEKRRRRVVADSPAEPPVAANVGMVEAPPPTVVPDLPILGQEERAAVVAEVGDRRPATLAEERPRFEMALNEAVKNYKALAQAAEQKELHTEAGT